MSGLLVNGIELLVPGLDVYNHRDAAWARLDPRDFRLRRTPWVRQVIIHTTKGMWPQRVLPGKGSAGAARRVADYWRNDPDGSRQSAAHLVVDRDGSVACLADLAAHCAYHATVSNEWSVGIEMYQEGDGGIYEAVLAATVTLVAAICEALMIPFQVAGDVYRDEPIERMVDGGRDCVGIFGHRDNTYRRGRGDPGDEIYKRLIAAGAEPLCYAAAKDLGAWKHRQSRLNLWGARLAVDGVCGPVTIREMRRLGFAHGREIDAAVEDPRGA